MMVTLYLMMVFLIIFFFPLVGNTIYKGIYGHYKWYTSGKQKNMLDKSSSYECSFFEMNELSNTYTLQFFTIGLSFMLFDLEILLIIPSLLVSLEMYWITVTMVMFLLLVMLATYYEVMEDVW